MNKGNENAKAKASKGTPRNLTKPRERIARKRETQAETF